ncbi:hypothetical protein [Staphylococcus saprophyticus]|nr:hypothetical protein [Staphylococcus saprophyticus]
MINGGNGGVGAVIVGNSKVVNGIKNKIKMIKGMGVNKLRMNERMV